MGRGPERTNRSPWQTGTGLMLSFTAEEDWDGHSMIAWRQDEEGMKWLEELEWKLDTKIEGTTLYTDLNVLKRLVEIAKQTEWCRPSFSPLPDGSFQVHNGVGCPLCYRTRDTGSHEDDCPYSNEWGKK